MASLINGITVTLYERTRSGKDAFNSPVYTQTAVEVPNVLVSPAGTSAITGELQLSGGCVAYELCIPKGDVHEWENRQVSFFGHIWKTVGPVQEWIEENLPLDWNKKIRVERYV